MTTTMMFLTMMMSIGIANLNHAHVHLFTFSIICQTRHEMWIRKARKARGVHLASSLTFLRDWDLDFVLYFVLRYKFSCKMSVF